MHACYVLPVEQTLRLTSAADTVQCITIILLPFSDFVSFSIFLFCNCTLINSCFLSVFVTCLCIYAIIFLNPDSVSLFIGLLAVNCENDNWRWESSLTSDFYRDWVEAIYYNILYQCLIKKEPPKQQGLMSFTKKKVLRTAHIYHLVSHQSRAIVERWTLELLIPGQGNKDLD